MRYQRRATPLHAARAPVALAYCLALGGAAVLYDDPLILGALVAVVLGAGALAQSLGLLVRALRWIAGLALVAAVLNPLFAHQGLTVLVRLGHLPPFGELDITLESIVFGAVFALKLCVLALACTLAAVAVDPDGLLRALRRASFRSALTATLATRMVGVLALDGRRLAEAQRCRALAGIPTTSPTRVGRQAALVRAVATGALDRALDVAATLELRGYAGARRPPRMPQPWSRHDIAFAGAAGALGALALGARLAGVGSFSAYPTVHASAGPSELVLTTAMMALALAPSLDRRGVRP